MPPAPLLDPPEFGWLLEYDDFSENGLFLAVGALTVEASLFSYPDFLHSSSNADTNALKSTETILPNNGWYVDHLPAVRRGEVMPNAMRANRRGSSRSGQACRMACIWTGSGAVTDWTSNLTASPDLQKVHDPHKPSGTAFVSPK